MDAVKECIADAIGPGALEIADQLGDAAVKQVLAIARELLTSGVSVIVEGFFQSDRYSYVFADLTTLADSIHVHMYADDSVLKHRYELRALSEARHWIHGDLEKLGTLNPELPTYMAEPLHLNIPLISVDTSAHKIDAADLAHKIQATLRTPVSEQSA